MGIKTECAGPRLNLLVLRSADIEQAVTFYTALGLSMTKHAHGSGPQHYAVEVSGFVLEIYPASAKSPATVGVRIGFRVDCVDQLIGEVSKLGGEIVSAPQDSEWGRRAVVKDLDGHVVELISRGVGA